MKTITSINTVDIPTVPDAIDYMVAAAEAREQCMTMAVGSESDNGKWSDLKLSEAYSEWYLQRNLKFGGGDPDVLKKISDEVATIVQCRHRIKVAIEGNGGKLDC